MKNLIRSLVLMFAVTSVFAQGHGWRALPDGSITNVNTVWAFDLSNNLTNAPGGVHIGGGLVVDSITLNGSTITSWSAGSQTPWLQDIDAGGHNLWSLGNFSRIDGTFGSYSSGTNYAFTYQAFNMGNSNEWYNIQSFQTNFNGVAVSGLLNDWVQNGLEVFSQNFTATNYLGYQNLSMVMDYDAGLYYGASFRSWGAYRMWSDSEAMNYGINLSDYQALTPIQGYTVDGIGIRAHSDFGLGGYISTIGGIALELSQMGWDGLVDLSTNWDSPILKLFRGKMGTNDCASPVITLCDPHNSGPYIHGDNAFTLTKGGSMWTGMTNIATAAVLDFKFSHAYVDTDTTWTDTTNRPWMPHGPVEGSIAVYIVSGATITWPSSSDWTDVGGTGATSCTGTPYGIVTVSCTVIDGTPHYWVGHTQ